MAKLSQSSSQKQIECEKNPEFWENFSNASTSLLSLLKNSIPNSENFGIADPSKIKNEDSLSVSLFLYSISENVETKNRELTDFPGKKKYSFSEQILNYIVTVQSENHRLEMDMMEKILGVIFSNPDIVVSKTVPKIHLRINHAENAIEVWNKLFPSIPYRQSILLTVHGPGVVFMNSEIKQGMDLNFYDSNRI